MTAKYRIIEKSTFWS